MPRVDNYTVLDVILTGPQGSLYEGGKFICEFYYPLDYPFVPPKFKICTKIYHPNVYQNGFCILIPCINNWSPAFGPGGPVKIIKFMLIDPNLECPANPAVARHWKKDEDDAIKTAKEWTLKYASPDRNEIQELL